MKIALYCPLNDPDDGGTSGDRRMARQIRTVLTSLGHMVQTVTAPRTHALQPDGDALDGLRAKAVTTVDRLQQDWASGNPQPDLWMTYHNYHKAPDLLGPLVAARLMIPYVIVEASYSRSKHGGPWGARTEAASQATAAADLHFCFTGQDRLGLLEIVDDPERLVDLPPFIDTAPFAGIVPALRTSRDGPVRLVSVAMMRKGDKARSYAALAQALTLLPDLKYVLSLVGGGAARPEIEAMFQGPGATGVNFEGLVPHAKLPKHLAAQDLFVWPGLHEPFGLVFLEAQAAGLPVVAFRSGGVPDTVRDGETALLVPEGDGEALAVAIARLAADHALRGQMAAAARRFALGERDMAGAARVIGMGLHQAISHHLARKEKGA